jgi:hypothetical protein
VRYELGFYIPEQGILYSHGRENLKSYIAIHRLGSVAGKYVSPVRYELDFYIPEDILQSHRRDNLKSYIALTGWVL